MNAHPLTRLNALEFRQAVLAGAACLEANADAINALNVFPVPDGDTGVNMLLTLRAAAGAPMPDPASATVGAMSAALARGALLGARGNSGVIFSQFMKGLAGGLEGAGDCDGHRLAAALVSAANAAYQAVGTPVEGTMLTVMRAAAEAAPAPGPDSVTEALRGAYAAAEQALARTPEQLPVLKQAGVVDAGGQGVVAFLAGALGFAEGTEATLEITAPAGGAQAMSASVSHDFLEHTEEELYGYCTQFVVQGAGLDPDAVREQVMAMAASTVVVGDDAVVRVHAHAEDPGPLLSMGAALGALDQINIQNMDLQHGEFMTLHGYGGAEPVDFAVVAVAPGDGIRRVFEDLGAAGVVAGGQTMNPSAADILEGARRANSRRVVVLPNNKNIILAAEQARDLADEATRIDVAPSRTVPQGVAAMLAYNPERGSDENVAAMTDAISNVRSGEVTTAVRDASIDGVDVAEGETIALLDGSLVASADSPEAALTALLEAAAPEEGALVTLYYGAGLTGELADAAAGGIAARFEGVEVETVEGGQPHYQYIVSIE